MLKTITRLSAAAMSLSGLLALPVCHAETRPLWELGAGISVLRMPDYRGSDVTNVHVLPVPYLVYRGEFLKADQGGLRGLLFESERLEINISLNGTLPALDDDNPARQGMDELKPTAEVGPTADFHLWRSADRKTRLDLRLPVRTAITVESDPRQIGWLFSPNLILELRDPAGLPGWNLSLQGGPYFNDREYNGYFYSVSPSEATVARPAYDASGGYSGTQVMFILTRRFAHHWVGGYVRYDNLSGAVYEDSPLVETQHAVAAGVAVSWVFGESSRRVEVGE
ncbi:MAG: MipA/OmpV family protein [Thiobacillus sp.]|uniref:MipA/OmpV family protein n=1 Tax=Thiobacillus sp. TaxID=924 RepID=UPI00289547CD|nr:MipA/OmpV family protein [Thiobacillus sp.]MDT3708329.1 MipA/OmpV family protein [Thiobacillus sp.]